MIKKVESCPSIVQTNLYSGQPTDEPSFEENFDWAMMPDEGYLQHANDARPTDSLFGQKGAHRRN
jgi:hypothetical protein